MKPKKEPKPRMAATIDIRVPVDPTEHAALLKRAGEKGLAGLFRELAGLPPRERGRPKSPKPKGEK